MITDGEIKRLRVLAKGRTDRPWDATELLDMAHAVAALLDEIKRLRAENKKLDGLDQALEHLQNETANQGNYIEELENLLAKAREALEKIRYLPVRKGGGVVVADIARQALKEIGE